MQPQGAERDADRFLHVSILTRPEGRMQLSSALSIFTWHLLFQSSPGQKAGCNLFLVLQPLRFLGFQSSPGHKAGCNVPWESLPSGSISFQSSPGQKAGCNKRASTSG